ncbi:LysR substrate-binding domain-containing protein [Marinobacter sp. ELB17]|uniref:LysR substrate-binding domain-containing protein n=1 Tax=Marinobacter sp. ELB17 TaxID=270374 RepID=UPI00067FA97F|nr:LysR substrate-binding domain-containing protein [Marinobacter sp. ELB17]
MNLPLRNSAFHPLEKVVFEFVVSTDHPLAKLPTPLPASAIHDYPTVIVADSSMHLLVRSSGLLDGRSRIIVPTIEHKVEAQCKGLGVGYLPRHRITRELAEGHLILLTLDVPRPPVEISSAWPRANPGRGFKWFVDHLKLMQFDSDNGLVAQK